MDDFWPQSIGEALRVIGQIVGAAAIAVAAVWKALRVYIHQKIQKECEDRKLADSNIEAKLRTNNEDIHVAMGKTEMIQQQLHDIERIRISETHRLEMVLERGLNAIKLEIEKLRRD